MTHFDYGQKEMDYLKRKDKKLGAAIERIGLIRREIMPDLFAALIWNIVSQQISKKAAETVWGRLTQLLGETTPESISSMETERLRGCGFSERKAGYMKSAADAVLSGVLDLKAIPSLPDEEVVRRLSALRGIGVWTAEMLLIFSLCRPDVVSYKDLAICRGMMKLYGLKELSREAFERYRKRYSPYGSVASLYLWAISAM